MQRRFVLPTSLAIVTLCAAGYLFFIREDRSGSFDLNPLPVGYHSHGIDVSHHQGKIDWDELLSAMDSTLSFIYCKATEGVRFVDDQWETNEAALSQSHVSHGAYHFFKPKQDAIHQADHFLSKTIGSYGTLPPVLDVETAGNSDRELIDKMKQWLQRVEQTSGIRPVIYTSYHYYVDKFRGKFSGYQFWIASYSGEKPGLNDPEVIHWQYSDHGRIPGTDEYVDLNFSKQTL